MSEPGIADYLDSIFPEGKIKFGISVFPHPAKVRSAATQIKKTLTRKGRSVRIFNRDFTNLDAGTLHKEGVFTKANTVEIVLLSSPNQQSVVCKTVAAQNVEQFAKRDYEKPVRDMQVGMLPPKLALMMLSLSAQSGALPSSIWDPFCGSGTVVNEAMRLGVDAVGTDINPKMVAAALANASMYQDTAKAHIFLHDATKPLETPIDAEAIVSEGYLGPIYQLPLTSNQVKTALADVIPVYEGFLPELAKFTNIKTCVISFPFWKTKTGDAYCHQLIKQIEQHWQLHDFSEFGIRRPFRYRRPQQIVGREIFVLNRK